MASACVSTASVSLIEMQHEMGMQRVPQESSSSPDAIELCNTPDTMRRGEKSFLITTLPFGTTLAGMAPPECISKPARIPHPNAGHPKGPRRFACNLLDFGQQVHLSVARKTLKTWLRFKIQGTSLGPQNVELWNQVFFRASIQQFGGLTEFRAIMIIDTPGQ